MEIQARNAAALATLDLGEGIRPAIQSGLLAAEAILHHGDYSLASIPKYSWPRYSDLEDKAAFIFPLY